MGGDDAESRRLRFKTSIRVADFRVDNGWSHFTHFYCAHAFTDVISFIIDFAIHFLIIFCFLNTDNAAT